MSTAIRNKKALIFLVVVLLVSNIGLLLYFMVWKKPGFRQGNGSRGNFSIVDFMKKEVGFDDEQTKKFKELHDANLDSLKMAGENIRKSKNELYKLLQQGNVSDSLVKAAVGQVSENQKKMELTMFHHFQRVRAICNPDQQVKFDSLVNRMNNRPPWFRRGGPPGSGNEKRKE